MRTFSRQRLATARRCSRALLMTGLLHALSACQVDNPAYFVVQPTGDAAGPADLAATGGAAGTTGGSGGAGGSINGAGRDGSVPLDVPTLMPRDANPIGPGCPNDVDLVLCLRFEGNAVDESIHGLKVDLKNGGFAPGTDGMALAMSGNTTLQVAEAAPLKVAKLTIEMSVNPGQLPGNGQRMGLVDRDPDFGLFLLPDGRLFCKINGVEAGSLAALSAGQWARIACIYDLTGISLFVAGRAEGGRNYTAPITGLATTGLTIGANTPAGTSPFVGLIDTVRIWGRALVSGEL